MEYHPGCELARYSRVIYYISTMTVDAIYIHVFSIRKRDFSASYVNLLGDIYQVLVRHQVVDVLVNQASGKIFKIRPPVQAECPYGSLYVLPRRRLLPFLCLFLAWPPSMWKVVLSEWYLSVPSVHFSFRLKRLEHIVMLHVRQNYYILTKSVCSTLSDRSVSQHKINVLFGWKVARLYIKKGI